MDFIKRRSCRGPAKGASFWAWGAVFALWVASQACAQSGGNGPLQTLGLDELKSDYTTMMASDDAWKALVAGAASMGYTLTSRWSNGDWGVGGTVTRDGKAVTMTWRVYDLDQVGSPDAAALEYLSDGVNTYRALEVAQDRDPLMVKEFTAVKTPAGYQTQAVHGFWSCMKSSLQSACEGPCSTVLTDCESKASLMEGAFSWAAYLGCAYDTCGTCLATQVLYCAPH